MYVFAGKDGLKCSAKLYGLKIYGSNGALVRDYVPGIKDDVVGLYDRVNDRFFSSGTSTPLEAGPVVERSKPDAFVEYVASSGSQWVDTGVDGRAGVKAEADDASLANAVNWCGDLQTATDAVVCAPWLPAVSSESGFAVSNLTVTGGNLAFADGTNTVAGTLTADGALAFTKSGFGYDLSMSGFAILLR